MTEIPLPKEFYYWIGVIAILLLGQIGFIATLLFRAGRFVTATELGISNADRKADIAHSRIDKHSTEIKQINQTLGGLK